MKMLVKLFIYMTIIVIISLFNIIDMTQAKSLNRMSDLMGMDEPPETAPQFESSVPRMRRDIGNRAADEGDIPQDEPKPETRFRVKRQMPSPPGDMIPMPPM